MLRKGRQILHHMLYPSKYQWYLKKVNVSATITIDIETPYIPRGRLQFVFSGITRFPDEVREIAVATSTKTNGSYEIVKSVETCV